MKTTDTNEMVPRDKETIDRDIADTLALSAWYGEDLDLVFTMDREELVDELESLRQPTFPQHAPCKAAARGALERLLTRTIRGSSNPQPQVPDVIR